MSSRFSYRGQKKAGAKKFYGGVKKPRTKYTKKSRTTKSGPFGTVKQAFGAESKTVTLAVAGPTATIAVNGATVQNQNLSTGFCCCTFVQQGDGNHTRDGNVITGRHLGIRFSVQSGGNAETSDAEVRWMVVLDKSPNYGNTALSTILYDADQAGAYTCTFNSAVNPDNAKRFMIMRQGTVTVSKVSGPSPLIPVSISLPLYGLQTAFSGSANPMTYAYVQANGLYFICFGRMTGAGTLPTISNFLARYTFAEK